MKKSQLKKIIKEEIKSTLKEGREHSSNVEVNELLDMIRVNIDYLHHGDDLIIRVNHSDDMNGYDVEFETIDL